jgi:iduronate 2-sulfatase
METPGPGHRRPHVPWRLPRKWWDLYAQRPVAPPTQPSTYAGAPEVAFTCGDQCEWVLWDQRQPPTPVGQGHLTPATYAQYTRQQPLSGNFSSTLRRAYSAAVSLMDDAIGRTLAVLEELDLQDSTVVVMHADHVSAMSMRLVSTTSHLTHTHHASSIRDGAWAKEIYGTNLRTMSIP